MTKYKQIIHSTLSRLFKAIGYSLAGLGTAWHYQFSFRCEILLSVIIVPLAWWLANDAMDYVLLISCWMLILIVEIINSAIEVAIDRISLEHNELSGRAKDYGSAAVFLACINAVMIWGIKLYQTIFFH